MTTVRGFLAQATRVEANESTIQNSGSFVDFLQTEKYKAVDPSLRSASKRRALAALQAQPPVSIRPGKAAWSTPSGRSSLTKDFSSKVEVAKAPDVFAFMNSMGDAFPNACKDFAMPVMLSILFVLCGEHSVNHISGRQPCRQNWLLHKSVCCA